MEYDIDKVDDMILALFCLTSSTDKYGTRAWKGLDSHVLDRLQAKGYVGDPREKSPTISLTEVGSARSKELFAKYFGKEDASK